MSQKCSTRAWDSYGLSPVAKLLFMRVSAAAEGEDGEKEEHALLFTHTIRAWCGCSHTQMVEALYELKRKEDITNWRFVDVNDKNLANPQKYDALLIFLPARDSYFEGDYADVEEQPSIDDIAYEKGAVTKIDPRRVRIFAKTGGVCFYCTDASAEQLDHMHPSSRGGSDADENMIGACTTCNVQKKDRTVEEYRAYLAYKRRVASVAEIKFYGEEEAA